MSYLNEDERAAAVTGLAASNLKTEAPAPAVVPPATPPAETPAETPAVEPVVAPPATEPVVAPVVESPLSKQHDALLAKMDVLFDKLTPREAAKVEAVAPAQRESYWESVLKNEEISADERAHAEQGLKLEQRLAKTEARLEAAEAAEAQRESDAWVETNLTEFRKQYDMADAALTKVFEWIGDPKNALAVPHLTFEDMARKSLGHAYLAAHARTPDPPAPKPVPVKEPRPATVVAESTPGSGAQVTTSPEVPGVSGIRSATMDILQNHRSKIGSYD